MNTFAHTSWLSVRPPLFNVDVAIADRVGTIDDMSVGDSLCKITSPDTVSRSNLNSIPSGDCQSRGKFALLEGYKAALFHIREQAQPLRLKHYDPQFVTERMVGIFIADVSLVTPGFGAFTILCLVGFRGM
jgi:hypothetical protein